ncbi:hypothetical protein NEUTE2DRAFT_129949 [Neurospora tetrasperma FGSC 2509]|nr:hypothetical protein NEUTE2DRAFT_129949 [Neurospora tetrasperma FGSC 2509]
MVSRSRPLGNALSRKRPAVPSSRSYLTSRSHPLKNLLSDGVLIVRGAKDLGVQIDQEKAVVEEKPPKFNYDDFRRT